MYILCRGLDIPEVDLVVQCEPPKDVDSYIHRAGRTGRAGKTGTCICFYKPNQVCSSNLKQVDIHICRRSTCSSWLSARPASSLSVLARLKQKISSERRLLMPNSTIQVTPDVSHTHHRFLDQVPAKILPLFHEAAQELIDSRDSPLDALAAALAHISGSTEIKERSLLGSQTGFVTYHMQVTNMEIRSKGFVWSVLRRQLPEDVVGGIRGLKLQKDSLGACFDV